MDFSLLESVPDAMIIAHRDGRIAWVNGVAEQLFGYTREELQGSPVEILLPARFREGHHLHRDGYHTAPRRRPMGLGLDLFGLRKSGEEFPAEISLAPMKDGEDVYAVAAVRDVTDRKKIEARAMLYRKAQAEVRERDEFLSIASHELRTPVTALQLQLQMLQRAAERSVATLPDLLAGKVDGLEKQCRRIAVLVNELLDVSRMRLGRLELKLEEVDLAELVAETLGTLREQIRSAGCTVRLDATAPAVGQWDRLRIEQVFTNLLANAIKFGQGKPVLVQVTVEPATAHLSVADNGIGIAAEHQLRVFDRFERAVSSSNFGGLGLGLYISRQIVEAHGGAIRLESAPGAGTTLTVDLPRTPRPVAQVA
ncbi:MAG TPA: PAS domain-containing sensor histidine kinase [Anaeromyxobacteraceae bacterium]|jgi:PAS domain S-box-containing protein|nr:PAS domain-containing sensor histidine kinase [Anaeromyxobacteraceae bacterium]